jgi:DNA-binding CsgD family transcriptional regulator
MDGFFFFYTMTILAVCMFSALIAVVCGIATNRKSCYAEAVMFTAYFVELGSIFFNEYLSQNLDFPIDQYYAIETPVPRILIGAIIIASGSLALLRTLGVQSRKPYVLPLAGFIALSLMVVYLMPYGSLRQWLFYTLRQIYMAATLAYATWFYKHRAKEEVRLHVAKYRPVFWFLIAGLFGVTIEDAVVILRLDPAQGIAALPLYLSERNFCENFVLVVLSIFINVSNIRTLLFRLQAIPTAEKNAPLKVTHEDLFAQEVEDLMPRFAADHTLTPREQEVLFLVIEGKSNTEIAEKLVLSVGTVKTHVHNITRKCGVASREELKQLFWKA